jgi:hypothetical protein
MLHEPGIAAGAEIEGMFELIRRCPVQRECQPERSGCDGHKPLNAWRLLSRAVGGLLSGKD